MVGVRTQEEESYYILLLLVTLSEHKLGLLSVHSIALNCSAPSLSHS